MSRNQKEYDPTSPMQLFIKSTLFFWALALVTVFLNYIFTHPIISVLVSLLILMLMLIKFFKSQRSKKLSKQLSKKLTNSSNSKEIYQALKEIEEQYESSIKKKKYPFYYRATLVRQKKDAYSKIGYFAAISSNIKNFIDHLKDIDRSDDLYEAIKENEIIKSLKYYHRNKRGKWISLFNFIKSIIFWGIWIIFLLLFIDSSMKLFSLIQKHHTVKKTEKTIESSEDRALSKSNIIIQNK